MTLGSSWSLVGFELLVLVLLELLHELVVCFWRIEVHLPRLHMPQNFYQVQLVSQPDHKQLEGIASQDLF